MFICIRRIFLLLKDIHLVRIALFSRDQVSGGLLEFAYMTALRTMARVPLNHRGVFRDSPLRTSFKSSL